MRIAVAGSGVSGLVSAWLLAAHHEVVLFEADDRPGGHTNTVDVALPSGDYAVDTGFIVCNDRTYPNFLRLLDELDVATQPSDMTFSVSCERTGLEWAGTDLNGVFAQRANAVRPRFLRMLADVARFGRLGQRRLRSSGEGEDLGTLADFVAEHRFSAAFVDLYLVPLGASIWSAEPATFDQYPLRPLLAFLDHHGLLDLRTRPQWMTVRGGSRTYVRAITAELGDRVRLGCPVERVTRSEDKVEVASRAGAEVFDHVVVAGHSDQALALLGDPTPAEQEVLGAIRYVANEATLHTDRAMLPRSPRAWAAWNYHRLAGDQDQVAVTYDMNRLQRLGAVEPICVTLNRHADIDPATVLARIDYAHPVYDPPSDAARRRRDEISGRNRTSYVGASWHNGFHEDGVRSAVEACRPLGSRWA